MTLEHHVPPSRGRAMGRALLLGVCFLWGINTVLAQSSSPNSSSPEIIFATQADLRSAMEDEIALGYSPTTTTNSARFFAGVVLRLAREAHAADPEGPYLFLRNGDWYAAYVEATGIDTTNLPLHVELANKYRQDVLIDYNYDNVVKRVRDGEVPELALSVQIGWPESPGGAKKYSYEDTLSKPKLQVTNHRLIRHRLLDFGDVISYDEVTGMTGRPTTGVLAAIFKIIGEGRVEWSRIKIADNGVQIARGRAKKGPFAVVETVHVRPDGTGDKGLPAETAEWVTIEDRLKEKPRIEYHDWSLPDFDPNW